MKALVAVALFGAVMLAADPPSVTFTKDFKGSVPAWVCITVDKDGHGTYKEAADDDNPLQFDVPAGDVAQVFELAGKLDHFTHPLESHLKVAYTGTKTLTYQDGGDKHATSFNYSLDPSAQSLLNWFENLSSTEQSFIDLDRTVHFDKLGVNDALLRVNILYDQQELITPHQFLPLLTRVSNDESIMHIARERAAALAEAFQKPPAQEKPGR